MNRRDLLKTATLLPLAAATQPLLPLTARKRAVRVAYMGDTHLQVKGKSAGEIAKCFHHIQNQADKPAFILHGGDVIMDALAQDKDQVQKQWDAWHGVINADNTLPIEYCIGNHDVWGYKEAKTDPLYGKKWVVDLLHLGNRYRSFDRNGWHFIILDGVQPKPDGSWYTAHLDPEQLDWLKADLQKTDAKTPILMMSHIPIVSATVFHDRRTVKDGNWVIPGGWDYTDAADLIELFYQYPNIKTVLSGHMHLLDRAEYNNVTYFCNGAVSGNWWTSDIYYQTRAGYALFDLYDDGTVERTYLQYA